MKCEWWIRYPTRKKPRPKEYCGIEGRLRGLELVKNDNMIMWVKKDDI